MKTSNPRDWPEDFPHENGNYLCTCKDCNELFNGYKRRVQCKACYLAALSARLADAQARNAQILRDFHAEIHDGQSESAHDVIQRLVREKQEAQARAERAEGALHQIKDAAILARGEAGYELDDIIGYASEALTPSSQRSDGERLDWLEGQLDDSFYTLYHFKRASQLDGDAAKNFSAAKPYYVGSIWDEVCGESLRAAIDAAMDATTPEVKGGGE